VVDQFLRKTLSIKLYSIFFKFYKIIFNKYVFINTYNFLKIVFNLFINNFNCSFNYYQSLLLSYSNFFQFLGIKLNLLGVRNTLKFYNIDNYLTLKRSLKFTKFKGILELGTEITNSLGYRIYTADLIKFLLPFKLFYQSTYTQIFIIFYIKPIF